jgi:hypothetical protein
MLNDEIKKNIHYKKKKKLKSIRLTNQIHCPSHETKITS